MAVFHAGVRRSILSMNMKHIDIVALSLCRLNVVKFIYLDGFNKLNDTDHTFIQIIKGAGKRLLVRNGEDKNILEDPNDSKTV